MPERDERTTVFGWASVALMALAGAAIAYLGVWTAEAVAPVERHHAVILRVNDADGAEGHERFGYDLEAMTGDGRVIALAPGQERVDRLSIGEPVIVTLSRATGRPLSVRYAEGDVELHHHTTAIVLVTVAGLFAAVVAWRARPLLAAASAVLPVAPRLLVAAVTATAVAVTAVGILDRETGGDIRHVADGMDIYGDPEFFPERVVAVGEEAPLDGVFVTARGPAAEVTTPGPDPALRVVAVPVTLRNPTPETVLTVRLVLIGEGQGETQMLRGSRCGDEPGALVGTFPHGTTTGRLCFVVAQRFDPRYLILERGDTSLALDVRTGPGAAGKPSGS
ncbi:hypothetical protein ACFVU3_05510 [Streptomyces sp. NPDC058052]|uniref:hypothetical protein n=1 Tax=Streptomyces sp. NPDC058052 TaxID=3346316 RepID=UPI0036E08D32